MWGMITALVSGALMSIQGVFNSAVMKQTSMWVSAGWVQISAFVVCLLMWLFTGRGAVSELCYCGESVTGGCVPGSFCAIVYNRWLCAVFLPLTGIFF